MLDHKFRSFTIIENFRAKFSIFQVKTWSLMTFSPCQNLWKTSMAPFDSNFMTKDRVTTKMDKSSSVLHSLSKFLASSKAPIRQITTSNSSTGTRKLEPSSSQPVIFITKKWKCMILFLKEPLLIYTQGNFWQVVLLCRIVFKLKEWNHLLI